MAPENPRTCTTDVHSPRKNQCGKLVLGPERLLGQQRSGSDQADQVWRAVQRNPQTKPEGLARFLRGETSPGVLFRYSIDTLLQHVATIPAPLHVQDFTLG